MRKGLPNPPKDKRVDGPKPGEIWAFAWDTDEGVRAYVGKVVDVTETECGVRYAAIIDDDRLGSFGSEVVRTPMTAAVEQGIIQDGKYSAI